MRAMLESSPSKQEQRPAVYVGLAGVSEPAVQHTLAPYCTPPRPVTDARLVGGETAEAQLQPPAAPVPVLYEEMAMPLTTPSPVTAAAVTSESRQAAADVQAAAALSARLAAAESGRALHAMQQHVQRHVEVQGDAIDKLQDLVASHELASSTHQVLISLAERLQAKRAPSPASSPPPTPLRGNGVASGSPAVAAASPADHVVVPEQEPGDAARFVKNASPALSALMAKDSYAGAVLSLVLMTRVPVFRSEELVVPACKVLQARLKPLYATPVPGTSDSDQQLQQHQQQQQSVGGNKALELKNLAEQASELLQRCDDMVATDTCLSEPQLYALTRTAVLAVFGSPAPGFPSSFKLSLRLNSLALLRSVFAKGPSEVRTNVLAEVVHGMNRMVQDNVRRVVVLDSSIKPAMTSVLLLQLLQSVAHDALVATAIGYTRDVLDAVHRCAHAPTILRDLVADVILLLDQPEWPIAEVLLVEIAERLHSDLVSGKDKHADCKGHVMAAEALGRIVTVMWHALQVPEQSMPMDAARTALACYVHASDSDMLGGAPAAHPLAFHYAVWRQDGVGDEALAATHTAVEAAATASASSFASVLDQALMAPMAVAAGAGGYCLASCKLGDDGSLMICCDKCGQWFHGACVLPADVDANSLQEWHCDACQRPDQAQRVLTRSGAQHIMRLLQHRRGFLVQQALFKRMFMRLILAGCALKTSAGTTITPSARQRETVAKAAILVMEAVPTAASMQSLMDMPLDVSTNVSMTLRDAVRSWLAPDGPIRLRAEAVKLVGAYGDVTGDLSFLKDIQRGVHGSGTSVRVSAIRLVGARVAASPEHIDARDLVIDCVRRLLDVTEDAPVHKEAIAALYAIWFPCVGKGNGAAAAADQAISQRISLLRRTLDGAAGSLSASMLAQALRRVVQQSDGKTSSAATSTRLVATLQTYVAELLALFPDQDDQDTDLEHLGTSVSAWRAVRACADAVPDSLPRDSVADVVFRKLEQYARRHRRASALTDATAARTERRKQDVLMSEVAPVLEIAASRLRHYVRGDLSKHLMETLCSITLTTNLTACAEACVRAQCALARDAWTDQAAFLLETLQQFLEKIDDGVTAGKPVLPRIVSLAGLLVRHLPASPATVHAVAARANTVLQRVMTRVSASSGDPGAVNMQRVVLGALGSVYARQPVLLQQDLRSGDGSDAFSRALSMSPVLQPTVLMALCSIMRAGDAAAAAAGNPGDHPTRQDAVDYCSVVQVFLPAIQRALVCPAQMQSGVSQALAAQTQRAALMLVQACKDVGALPIEHLAERLVVLLLSGDTDLAASASALLETLEPVRMVDKTVDAMRLAYQLFPGVSEPPRVFRTHIARLTERRITSSKLCSNLCKALQGSGAGAADDDAEDGWLVWLYHVIAPLPFRYACDLRMVLSAIQMRAIMNNSIGNACTRAHAIATITGLALIRHLEQRYPGVYQGGDDASRQIRESQSSAMQLSVPRSNDHVAMARRMLAAAHDDDEITVLTRTPARKRRRTCAASESAGKSTGGKRRRVARRVAGSSSSSSSSSDHDVDDDDDAMPDALLV